MADAASVTTVVVGPRLPWPDELSAPPARGPFDAAAIFHSGIRRECEIRKISALGATVNTDLSPVLGERVSVELVTGQRAAGKIAWTGVREIGVRFDDVVDIVALLNRKLVSQMPERRTMPRIEVRCLAHIKNGQHFRPAMLRNISSRGLQLEGEDLPQAGTFVSVFVEGLNMPSGEIVWRRNKLAGIEIMEELSWTSLIPWVRNIVKSSA